MNLFYNCTFLIVVKCIYIESSLVDSGSSPSNLFGVNDVMDFVTIFFVDKGSVTFWSRFFCRENK